MKRLQFVVGVIAFVLIVAASAGIRGETVKKSDGAPREASYQVNVASFSPSDAARAAANVAAEPTSGPGPSLVTVEGNRLIVRKRNANGSLQAPAPYTIKGVVWSPASRGTDTSPADPSNATVRRPEFGIWYETDIPLLEQMNANTVRMLIDPGFDAVLGPIGLAILDSCYAHDIMVIMTVDDAINDTTRVRQAVNFYKNHPAILLWSLGSEWNINRYFGVAPTIFQAAQRTEAAAVLIKSLDSNHPVVSSYGEIDIDAAGLRLVDTANYVNTICPTVDVWSVNIYRGRTFAKLFDEWASITTKPMFLGEFGVDAWHTRIPSTPDSGVVNELEQAEWDLSLWNHIFRNLSSSHDAAVALGGTVFAWNDEWWKVPPPTGSPDSQETGGWQSCGFPDGVGNEEFFGLVDIDRLPRQAYELFAEAFEPYSYLEDYDRTGFRVISAGALANGGYGFAEFRKDNCVFYSKQGGAGGGRGFNVAVVDPSSGDIMGPVRNFDTWFHRSDGTAMIAMINYLDSIPEGRLVLIAVGDEAGLNTWESCTKLGYAWIEQGVQALEALGSTRIREYCYWGSWAMIAVKGEGVAILEGIAPSNKVTIDTETQVVTGISDRTPLPDIGISCWPNPFNPVTTIEYWIPTAGPVKVTIYNVAGRVIQTLVDEAKAEGRHMVTWDGHNVRGEPIASGVYFVRVQRDAQRGTWKIVVLR